MRTRSISDLDKTPWRRHFPRRQTPREMKKGFSDFRPFGKPLLIERELPVTSTGCGECGKCGKCGRPLEPCSKLDGTNFARRQNLFSRTLFGKKHELSNALQVWIVSKTFVACAFPTVFWKMKNFYLMISAGTKCGVIVRGVCKLKGNNQKNHLH